METWVLLLIFGSQPAVPIHGYESRQACELARDVAKESEHVRAGICFPGPKIPTATFLPGGSYLDKMPSVPIGPNGITPNNLFDLPLSPPVLIGPDCCKVYIPD